MSEIKVRWLIRAAGRDVGHVETVEIDTPFMQGCLSQRRVEIVEAPVPTRGNGSVSIGEPGAEGLTVKPGPRHRIRKPLD